MDRTRARWDSLKHTRHRRTQMKPSDLLRLELKRNRLRLLHQMEVGRTRTVLMLGSHMQVLRHLVLVQIAHPGRERRETLGCPLIKPVTIPITTHRWPTLGQIVICGHHSLLANYTANRIMTAKCLASSRDNSEMPLKRLPWSRGVAGVITASIHRRRHLVTTLPLIPWFKSIHLNGLALYCSHCIYSSKLGFLVHQATLFLYFELVLCIVSKLCDVINCCVYSSQNNAFHSLYSKYLHDIIMKKPDTHVAFLLHLTCVLSFLYFFTYTTVSNRVIQIKTK